MPVTINCPICKSAGYTLVFDHKGSQFFDRRIVKCDGCGLVFVNPQPTLDELKKLYDGEISTNPERLVWDRQQKTYICENGADSESRSSKYPFPGSGRSPYTTRYNYRIKFIRKAAPPPGNILDIGCRDGMFLSIAKDNGYDGKGVEISSNHVAIAREKTGFDVFCGTLEQFTETESAKEQVFDVVTLWDVIEHLNDPAATLKKINGLQAKGGLLAVSTVNLMNYRYLVYKENWRGFREGEEHLFFFTPKTLATLMKKCGYSPVKVETRIIPPFLLKWLNLLKLGHSLEVYAKKTGDSPS